MMKKESWQRKYEDQNKSWKTEFRKSMKIFHKKIGKVV
jgi:hypothetical protein